MTESKTETITSKDGTKSETKSETKTDKNGVTSGTETTKTTTANGSTGMTVTTIENGESKTAAEAKVSGKAVEDAKKNGEAVKAPVEVEATRNSDTAPTVKVELPKGAGETKVEIPVSNATPGTVAVLVHPDGTEETFEGFHSHGERHPTHRGRQRDGEDHRQFQGFYRHARPLGQGRHRFRQRPWSRERHERHDLRAQQLHHPGAAVDDPRPPE